MNKTACVSSLIVLFAVSPALVGQQPGGNSSSARFRNERQAERTNPAERAALLAVTNAGANVIVNDAGSVEVVELEGCAFPDSLLEVLRDLPRLKQLKIGHTRVTDSSLQYVRPLTTLESLALIQTRVTDVGLVHLEGLRNLKTLTLHNDAVKDAGMRSLAKLENLQQLDLESTQVGDAGLAELGKLVKLKRLLLSRTNVTDAGLVHLKGLTDLVELALFRNPISDTGLSSLRGLTNLTELDLEGTNVTDAGLSSLADLKRLETLNLRHTSVTTPGLRQLKGLTGIKRLWTDGVLFSERVPEKHWQVWLASAYGDDLYVYEMYSWKLLKRIVVGPNPHGLSATADGRTVHVSLERFAEPRGELVWVDTKTFSITGRLELGPQSQEQDCTPDGKWIYVPCADGSWHVVDGVQRREVTTIRTGGRPHNTVISPDGKRMYLAPMGYPHAVSVVDIENGHQIIAEIPFKDVTRPPAISSDERFFFQNIDNMLGFQVADISQRKVVKTIKHLIPEQRRGETSRSHGLGVRPDQKEIWSCNVEHHLVHVHELSSGDYKEIATIALPGSVYWLSFSPDSKYCFVSVRSNRQVAVIDCVSKNIVTMLDGGHAVKRTQVVGVPLD
jgi:DNA-binding beta-propeller fold protein YncE